MGDRSDLHRTRSRGVRKLAPNILRSTLLIMNMINMIITVGQLELHVQHDKQLQHIQNNQHNLYDQHLQSDQQLNKHNKNIALDTFSGIHFAPSKRCCF